MDNKEYWDSLLRDLHNMSEEEFTALVAELDAQGYVPFAIGEI